MNRPNPANLQRTFLGLGQPPLASAAQWLIENFVVDSELGRTLDLSNVLLVLPAARSRQHILHRLVKMSDQQAVLFQPPRIMTLGQLPEHLYVATKPLASELTQHIVWVRALEQLPVEEMQPLLGDRQPNEAYDFQSLATVIAKLHIRLANDIWSFNSVLREVSKDKKFPDSEKERWHSLAAIQQRYYETLIQVGLWDRYGARNYAAAGLLKANEIRCSTEYEIVLVGCADLNRSTSEMLRQVAAVESQGRPGRARVVTLVAAEPDMADRFDDFGSLISEQWIDAPIPIDDEKIRFVDRPADQAFAVAHYLGQLPATEMADDKQTPLSNHDVTIGLPDDTLVPSVQRSLRSIGLSSRHLAGKPLQRSGPVRLLQAVAEYLSGPSFDAFAALVRHPDVFDWLVDRVQCDSWLQALDNFQNDRLPEAIPLDADVAFGNPAVIADDFDPNDPKAERRAKRNAENARTLNALLGVLRDWLKPVLANNKPINQWSTPWGEVLLAVYGDRNLDSADCTDAATIDACHALMDLFSHQDDVPEEFGLETSAVQGLTWLLESASTIRTVSHPQPGEIELSGWLDLPLDDAKVMIVTGFNEGNVPSSETGHQFLPNHLCEQLRVLDNNRRYARDAYALTVISKVRDNLLLVSGRRDEQGEPLRPSRLLFADSAAVAARRARAFFTYEGNAASANWLTVDASPHVAQQFTIPRPTNAGPINDLTVTSFREYMKCPYRFYLGRVLRLETRSDDWRELDAGAFGDLCHNVLETFANEPVSDSTDPQEIFAFLSMELNRQAHRETDGARLPAVQIQIEQLRQRFQAFAIAQANHRKQGWKIISIEELLEHRMEVDGQPFTIRGKIDRVDQHQTTGQIAVWDYKTSESGTDPRRKHYQPRNQKWLDLQLPLYRHLVREIPQAAAADPNDILTGFVLLHGKIDEIGFSQADWQDGELASAETTFREVVRKLRQGIFWPPTDPPPEFSEDFAEICQDHVFEQFPIDGMSDTYIVMGRSS